MLYQLVTPGVYTSLPTTGPDGGAIPGGMEIFFVPDLLNTTGNGNVIWHLTYDSASGKWRWIGGTPMAFGPSDGVDLGFNSGIFSSPSGVPNTYTLPFAGDWFIEHGHSSWCTSHNAQIDAGIRVNGGQPNSQKLAMAWNPLANTSQQGVAVGFPYPGLASGSTINFGIRTSVANAKLRNMWYNIRPIQVG
jgi:hypothetical protein